MHSDELLQVLMRGCRGGLSAIRSITKLQPSDGAGGKVFPPTYESGAYAFEDRMIGGRVVKTVLLDSVQSMSNRYEELLLGRISLWASTDAGIRTQGGRARDHITYSTSSNPRRDFARFALEWPALPGIRER